MADGWGWAGTVHEFLSTPDDLWLSSLSGHLLRDLLGLNASASQQAAWRDEFDCVADALRWCSHVDGAALEWGIAFECELPLEGGRRPDVVVLPGDVICVLEFKSASYAAAADLDQARAYARGLADYHKVSHGHRVVPRLVPLRAKGTTAPLDGTMVTGGDGTALLAPGVRPLPDAVELPLALA